MKRWLAAAVVALLTLTAGFIFVGLGAPTSATPVNHSSAADDETDESTEGAHEDRGDGQGPPSWAHATKETGNDMAWREVWTSMTGAQRERTMSRLADEHEKGMRAWRRCVSRGDDDCERPLPPGLAKNQLH